MKLPLSTPEKPQRTVVESTLQRIWNEQENILIIFALYMILVKHGYGLLFGSR